MQLQVISNFMDLLWIRKRQGNLILKINYIYILNMLLQQTNLSYYNQSLQVFLTMTEEFTRVSIINNLYCGDRHGNFLKMSTNTMERCFLLY